MDVENFVLNDDAKTGSVKIRMDKRELIDMLEEHYYFCHVFRQVMFERFDHSFKITPRSINRMEFLLCDIIHPFKEKVPNRFTKQDPGLIRTNTVIGMYMKNKFSHSHKYRQNLVHAMKQDVFEWELRFQFR